MFISTVSDSVVQVFLKSDALSEKHVGGVYCKNIQFRDDNNTFSAFATKNVEIVKALVHRDANYADSDSKIVYGKKAKK